MTLAFAPITVTNGWEWPVFVEIDRDTQVSGEFPQPSRDALMHIPLAIALRNNVLAFRVEGGDLHVLMPDVHDEKMISSLGNVARMRIVARAASPSALREHIALAYAVSEHPIDDDRGDVQPVARAVDDIHKAAIAAGASDIHLEPFDGGGRVRQRLDGLLHEERRLPASLFSNVVSRVKILAGMDIAERRLPQDGRYHIDVLQRNVDARVSSMPTMAGEKLVIRLLDMHARVPSLEQLGLPPQMLRRYRALVHAPYGFVVVCGPTGSGKTTTLYASLAERNVSSQHLCTIEDPIEVRMGGIAQVQVNERAGMTFAAALRSFLRQDPNVVMVGEMRDAETAKVAMSAALCGQLVMTTLHAADAVRAVERLVELGLSHHAIAAGLSGIVAQRLVRRLCTECRVRMPLSSENATALGVHAGAAAYAPRGCAACHMTGFRGRTGIFELLVVNDEIRSVIASGAAATAIGTCGRAGGYTEMFGDGLRAVMAGETSACEVRRVLGERAP